MTKEEKSGLYDFFETISSAIFESKPLEFCCEKPEFFDDEETAPHANASELQNAPIAQKPAEPTDAISAENASATLNASASETSSQSTIASSSDSLIGSIAEKIKNCNRCNLCKRRKNTVPGTGVLNPTVMVIGEGPGEKEDESGLPFVGAAGELLDKMLSSIGLSRNTNCFIANIVKCRPPMNRDPFPDEVEACSSFLTAQIHALKPKAILILGSPAVKTVLKTASGITSMRGKFYDVNGIPAIATYHPSALLRDPSKKMDAWTDLKTLRSFLKSMAGEN